MGLDLTKPKRIENRKIAVVWLTLLEILLTDTMWIHRIGGMESN